MAAPNPAKRPNLEPVPSESGSDRTQDMQRMFLARLRRLTWLRRSCSHQMEESTLRALDKSIYSTYCDCAELGLNEQAHDLLKAA